MPRISVCALFLLLSMSKIQAEEVAKSPTLTALEHVTVFVRDYDEALAFYVDRLGLVKIEDQRFGPKERWVTVATSPTAGTHIVLAVPNEKLASSIGHQHNWVFGTRDCKTTAASLSARGVHFISSPENAPWGCQAIFEDLYGNRIVLRSPRSAVSQ